MKREALTNEVLTKPVVFRHPFVACGSLVNRSARINLRVPKGVGGRDAARDAA